MEQVNERDRQRTRNKLMRLSNRADPHLGKYDELIVRELFRTESERQVMSNDKKKLCESVAEVAWQSVHNPSCKLSCIKIASMLVRIYQNPSAVKFYEQLLSQIINELCVEQAKMIDQSIQDANDAQILKKSWTKHRADLKFLLDYFVPNNVQGDSMRDSLTKTAIAAYRHIVIIGSNLHAEILKRFESNQMSNDEHITAIQILNAVQEQFFDVHLSSTLVRLTQLFEKSLLNGMTTEALVFESIDWLEIEVKKFAILSSDVVQMQFFSNTIREHIVMNLLVNHLKQDDKFCGLINEKSFEALKQLYSLFELIENGSLELLELTAGFIRKKKLTRHSASPKSPNRGLPISVVVINDFLAFKSLLFNSVLNDCFRGDKRYRDRIESELQRLVGTQEHFSQYLAFYFDYQLKRRHHDEIARATDLLPYIMNEEEFEKHYRGHLANRLIYGRNILEDVEKMMIAKLKTECGVYFTDKLNKMLADANLKNELTAEFHESTRDCIDTTAMVLTSGIWPTHSNITFHLPEELQSTFSKFTEFYQNKHNGRRLSIVSTACRAEITSRAFNDKKRYSFTVTVAQMSILDLFNASDSCEFPQIIASLEMKPKIACIALKPLIKAGVLKLTRGSLESEDAVLEFNESFTNAKVKVDLTKFNGKSEGRKSPQGS